MSIITNITGTACPILENDIDTDQIIPARYLKEITFKNMGKYAFYDARFDQNNEQKNHPLNNPLYKQASILITGKNFGCGSSREHAPQALMRYGFKAIIAESFAEIFAGNCKAIGIPVITVKKIEIDRIINQIKADPTINLSIDIKEERILINQENIPCQIEESRRKSFLKGTWNALDTLKKYAKLTTKKEKSLPY